MEVRIKSLLDTILQHLCCMLFAPRILFGSLKCQVFDSAVLAFIAVSSMDSTSCLATL